MIQKDEQPPVAFPEATEEEVLLKTIASLADASKKYAGEYFGHFLNETQIEDARYEVARMGTAAAHVYDVWQRSREALPSSAEIGGVVEPPTFGSQLRWRRSAGNGAEGEHRSGSRFTHLAQLNERVRKTTETVTEALPVLRDQVLYSRHFERNCMRLYGYEQGEIERLRYAEDLRLTLEQTLQAIQGDVDSLRAQTQSLTLYAQMHLAIQVQILTWIILGVTVIGVIAAFVN
jgi:hypothetical protein